MESLPILRSRFAQYGTVHRLWLMHVRCLGRIRHPLTLGSAEGPESILLSIPLKTLPIGVFGTSIGLRRWQRHDLARVHIRGFHRGSRGPKVQKSVDTIIVCVFKTPKSRSK